jgi:hypothetical protein
LIVFTIFRKRSECGRVEEVGRWKVGVGVKMEMGVVPMRGRIGVATIAVGREGSFSSRG